ncbi:MAG: bifunctional hydroxymethylpyrimidine kinase/phosphomethylpyrimidine kinase [Candidatus Binatia bacterium]
MLPVALTIAGSDPSGGAGLQADLKTFHAFGVYGASVVTVLTVQNTCEVRAVRALDAVFVVAQLVAVLDDLPVAAAKTGLLGDAAQVAALAECLRARPLPALVVDPVLVATAGQSLTAGDTARALREHLVPLASLVTPNLAEAEALTGRAVQDVAAMRDAARRLADLGARAVLVKGGHLPGAPVDVLLADGACHDLEGRRVGAASTHGTGCTLAAAITAGLAAGAPLADAIARARRYVTAALAAGGTPGHGNRPLNHLVHPNGGDGG